ncbi:DUF6221 family protein [Micromonospora deserti]|uniref:DUF6221 family protein n=1 Tax=Micromonospora deserti TaxID=2070366 RepID=UPI0018F5C68E|nr:DUF6221 family protein [Micromonospora deserti]
MTDELVTWLRAQLDDDERIAREAGYRAIAWPANGTWHLEGVEHYVVGEEEAFCHPHNVEHIARHDPARVLAEVDAKRRILDFLSVAQIDVSRPGQPPEFVPGEAPPIAHPVLRLLALPYAGRPGYRDEWRP